METTIYKYPLDITDIQKIEVPACPDFMPKILCVQLQNETPCLWVEVPVVKQFTTLKIQTYGTGHTIRSNKQQYIGTYQIRGLVFHVYKDLNY